MKPIILLPISLLAACVSHAPNRSPIVTASPVSNPVSSTGLRTQEQVKEYRFGRYVDPNDPLAMHEGHPVFRVETNAGWDLRPKTTKAQAPLPAVITTPPVAASDAVVAEVNKQRAATRAFTEQSARLNQQLSGLSQAVGQMADVAKQNLAIQQELTGMRERISAIDAQLRERPVASGQKPQKPNEDKW